MQAVETKVKAAAAGAGGGAAVGYALAELVCWLLDTHVMTPSVSGDLPSPVAQLVTAVAMAGVSAATAFVAGYRARHTPRHATAS